jgi:hypothetical protein
MFTTGAAAFSDTPAAGAVPEHKRAFTPALCHFDGDQDVVIRYQAAITSLKGKKSNILISE